MAVDDEAENRSDERGGQLWRDAAALDQLLDSARQNALRFLTTLEERPVQAPPFDGDSQALPARGVGAEAAMSAFVRRYEPHLSASPGPRYWGFVTGGVTPGALVGDWLAAAYDQNVAQRFDSVAQHVEDEAIELLCDLLHLPDDFVGSMVSGATTSNLSGLALGRQWVAEHHGVDISAAGVRAAPPVPVLAATAHASTAKALAVLGIGRDNIISVPTLAGREAVDPQALQVALDKLGGQPAIVVASAGTVNTVDFDDLSAVVALRDRFPFWLHVDGAFGAFAAVSPGRRHFVSGMEAADSVCVDAHKWLNVPYDSAAILTRHPALQAQVFASSSSYLGNPGPHPDAVHLTPQNSRRFRALPLWLTLVAYGRDGYQEIVERTCFLAAALGRRVSVQPELRLVAPVRMNVTCFTLQEPDPVAVQQYVDQVNASGQVLVTPTVLAGVPAVRAAFSNWRTTADDLDRAWDVLKSCVPGR